MARKDAANESNTKASRSKLWGWTIAVALILAACWGIRAIRKTDDAIAQGPAAAAPAAPGAVAESVQKPEVVAVVNGETVQRQELARECLRVFGKEVLESQVNKQLIVEHCKRANIVITKKDVDDEIDQMAKKFNLGTEQWLGMLKQERGISPQQYARDIVWPTLALKRLAASKLTVSQEELQAATETEFGAAVQCRMIINADQKAIREAYAQAKANPDDFPNLAKRYSSDMSIASAKGLFPPVRRHVGNATLEQAAFRLKEGEISQILTVENQYVILKCETVVPAAKLEDVALFQKKLEESIKDKKLRQASSEVFQQLQSQSKVVNVFNDPVKSKELPGVAALVNDQKITVRELSEECIERHGIDVLDALIHHKLLEQALKAVRAQVSQQDLDQELARAAATRGKLKPNGDPDVEGWLREVTQDGKNSAEVYIQDAIWPAAALKRLVGDTVKITQEDLKKGFEANFGPRARCRVIVVATQRKAQEVWSLAREKQTAEEFGKLAEQFSIEPGSRALQGKVPPIQRHGGQPTVEKEAFSLHPGELSGIVQLNDKFVIMFCEGFTEPTKVAFEEVRDSIYDDLFEKKLRIAVGDKFDQLKGDATIDNYLAGTTQSPKRNKDTGVVPTAGASQLGPNGNVIPAGGQMPPSPPRMMKP